MKKGVFLMVLFYFVCFSLHSEDHIIDADSKGKICLKSVNDAEDIRLVLSTSIDKCIIAKEQKISRKKNSIEVSKILYCDSLKTSCFLTEKYILTDNGVHCDVVIKGAKGTPWSMPIESIFQFITKDNSNLRFWTAWGSPNVDTLSMDNSLRKQLREYKGGCDAAKGWAVLGGEKNNRWVDPLIPVPFIDSKYYYGATAFHASDPMVGFVPAQNDLFAIPMAVILDNNYNLGYSIILSFKDSIIDLELETKANGAISFNRLCNRISQDNILHFSYDIVKHASDWRSGVGIAYEMYPEYFEPKNKIANEICGTGAYSASQEINNVEKLKSMAFGVNWQASFDFPYMGMFIPPLGENEEWETFGYKAGVTKSPTQSIANLNKVAKKFKENRFYSLSYFNVCEFGTGVVTPPPALTHTSDDDIWKDANNFVYGKLYNAILPMPKESLTDSTQINADYPIPYGTWGGAVAMDCGDPIYSAFLLDQAKKHIEYLPDSYGICIDRMDWLRIFNENADDKITWYSGKPVRSLYNSWKQLMSKLGPMMHNAGKVIYVNNHTRRIDLLNEVDGIFDEFTYMGNSLNLMALNCFSKPAMGWVDIAKTIENEGGDPFMQRHLYMGVFPMCPFEGNDHSIRPTDYVDKLYLDYGQMMQMMKGREWVLTPHAIAVENYTAKANIFKVNDGYIIPVVLGEGDKSRIILNGIELSSNDAKVYYPGEKDGKSIKIKKRNGTYFIDVRHKRNCAFIKINK